VVPLTWKASSSGSQLTQRVMSAISMYSADGLSGLIVEPNDRFAAALVKVQHRTTNPVRNAG